MEERKVVRNHDENAFTNPHPLPVFTAIQLLLRPFAAAGATRVWTDVVRNANWSNASNRFIGVPVNCNAVELTRQPPRFTRVNATTLILLGRGRVGELTTLKSSTDFVTWTPLGSTVAGPDDYGFVVNPTAPAFRSFRLTMP